MAEAATYISSAGGLVHGLASLIALLSSLLLLPVVLFFSPESERSSTIVQYLYTTCLVSNAIAAATVIVFYWDSVPDFQLSTTPAEKKGLTAQQVRSFNQGRCLSLLSQGTVPLLALFASGISSIGSDIPISYLTVQIPVVVLGCTIAAYGLFLSRFVLKLAPGMAFMNGLTEVISWGLTFITTDFDSVFAQYPNVATHTMRRAVLQIAFLQWGFLWYYLYSKNLATVDLCRKACKLFHAPLFLLMAISMVFVVRPVSDLPYTMLPFGVPISQMFLVLMIVKKKFGGAPPKAD